MDAVMTTNDQDIQEKTAKPMVSMQGSQINGCCPGETDKLIVLVKELKDKQ